MIGDFALIAYPAECGNSGVMTFLVNHHGTVFQEDLSPRTSLLASRISFFNPITPDRKQAKAGERHEILAGNREKIAEHTDVGNPENSS